MFKQTNKQEEIISGLKPDLFFSFFLIKVHSLCLKKKKKRKKERKKEKRKRKKERPGLVAWHTFNPSRDRWIPEFNASSTDQVLEQPELHSLQNQIK